MQIAAEVKNFDPLDYLPKTLVKATDRFMQFAIIAAKQALAQSKLNIAQNSDRIGIVMGTAMDGVQLRCQLRSIPIPPARLKKLDPRFVPMVIGNIAAAQVAIEYGIHGPSFTVNTACSSGGDAMMLAAMLLGSGEADAVLVMGGESILTPVVVSSLAQSKALSRRNDDPATACRPFDADRDGFVIGEGGRSHSVGTGKNMLCPGMQEIFARVPGYANTSDGYHVVSPMPDGAGAARCMQLALQRAGLTPSDIDYINAHGTSTPLGDQAETTAIKAVFGGIETAPPVSATKSATGHLMGAGGHYGSHCLHPGYPGRYPSSHHQLCNTGSRLRFGLCAKPGQKS